MLRRILNSFFVGFLLTLSFLFISKSPAFADDKFKTSVNMNYSVSDSGSTHVVSHILMTNLTDSFYVSSYTFKLGFTTVSNLAASDPTGPIVPSIKQTESGQEITLNFKSVVYGINKTLPFTFSFDTPDVAQKSGNIWEVNIPGLSNQNDFSDFSVHIDVPPSFGKPTVAKPALSNNSLDFTKAQLGKSGISLIFGDAQSYEFSLNYHLQNSNVFPVRTEIALPPTTNYQEVSLQSISPKPDNVVLDKDGNWLASYTLLPSQKITITASGLIETMLRPKEVLLSETDRKIYLQKQSYWQIDNSDIQKLAQQLKTPEAIYDYVVSHLTYDFSRVKTGQERIGALGVLQNPASAVCLEFTDLFVTLARAAGIPAREVDGFAYTQNTTSRPLSLVKDVLHAWPEYYDDINKTWVMVDPTWGNTTGGVDYFHTLDFDHVAFVIKGISSTYPVPAGGYKFSDQQDSKDVAVAVSTEKITDLPTIDMSISFPENISSGFPFSGNLVFSNSGTVLFPGELLHVTTNKLKPLSQFVSLPPLPPFGSNSQTISFAKTPFLTNTTDTIRMGLAERTITQKVTIVPFTRLQLIIGGIILVILTGIILTIAYKSRRLPTSR